MKVRAGLVLRLVDLQGILHKRAMGWRWAYRLGDAEAPPLMDRIIIINSEIACIKRLRSTLRCSAENLENANAAYRIRGDGRQDGSELLGWIISDNFKKRRVCLDAFGTMALRQITTNKGTV